MKVLLIFPGHRQNRPAIPFSILVLASYLRERDIAVDVLDTRVSSDLPKDIDAYGLIGLSVKTGEQISSAIDICENIRGKSRVPIVWGGPHATFFPDQTCGSPLVDFVAVGEGEETLYELACALRDNTSFSNIHGLVYKESGIIRHNGLRPFMDMTDVPLPAYDLVDIHQYQDSLGYFTIETSRGCPFRCAFCYVHDFHRRHWRAKPVQQTLNEIRQIMGRYGIRRFFICDDNFFADKSRVFDLLQQVVNQGLDIEIFTQARADYFACFTDKELSLLAKAGVRYVAIGAESGSQPVLDSLRKDISTEQIILSARNCIRHNMIPVFSFIIGLPGETDADLGRTIAMYDTLKAISSDIEINGFYIFTPYPGTPMFKNAVEQGYAPYNRLEEWRCWKFSSPSNLPWLNRARGTRLKVLSKIILFLFIRDRFRSYGKAFRQEKLGAWYLNTCWRIGAFFLFWDARLRLKRRRFEWGYEWLLFGKIADAFKIA